MKKLLLLLLIVVCSANSQNLALNKPVYASSVEAPGTNAKHFVNDGDYSTYWASGYQDNEWVYIDLQDDYNLGGIKIHWEAAYTKRYVISISSDNSNYDTVYTEENGDGGEDSINLNGVTGRYLKINCFERATVYGNAIYEVEIYGLNGEQRYADGTATDQDGNTFEWINYGTQDWAIKNAEVVTYRDGTPIPQVQNFTDWLNLTTGAWCYYQNDESKEKLYNWYAVAGIYDGASLNDESLRKDFAPNGWHVASESEWDSLVIYLIDNLYNYDSSTLNEWTNFDSNKLAKAMASTTGWNTSSEEGAIGNDLSLNNNSGFNIFPTGMRYYQNNFIGEGDMAFFWLTDNNIDGYPSYSYYRPLIVTNHSWSFIDKNVSYKHTGISVRFVRDASTASINDFSNSITIYPNPTSSLLALNSDKEYIIDVYDMAGNKVMALTGNTIDMSHLSSATYIVKALDKVENEEVSYKVVKN